MDAIPNYTEPVCYRAIAPPFTLLTKIDPARNMRRYYCIGVQPTLLGDWCVVCRYGRIGRSEHVLPPVAGD